MSPNSNSNLFRPPPPPPRPASRPVDPLTALSKPVLAPPTPSLPPTRNEPEALADLTDEDMEMWAMGGTRIIPKPGDGAAAVSTATPAPVTPLPLPPALAETMKSGEAGAPVAPTMMQSPSFPPLTMSSVPPPAMYAAPKKKSNAGVWLLVVGLTGLFGLGVVGAGVGYWVYQQREATELASTVTAEETNTTTAATTTTTAAPQQAATATATATAPATVTVTATTNTAPATTTTTSTTTTHATLAAEATHASRSHRAPDVSPSTNAPATTTATKDDDDDGPLTSTHRAATSATGASAGNATSAASSTTNAGSIRTFAAGAGKAVFVDGHLAGIGGTTPLKTTCGRHSIKVGEGKARSYEVPCSGSTITVGTPEGT